MDPRLVMAIDTGALRRLRNATRALRTIIIVIAVAAGAIVWGRGFEDEARIPVRNPKARAVMLGAQFEGVPSNGSFCGTP